MDKMITQKDLFSKIVEILRQDNRIPDIIDYEFVYFTTKTITNDKFELVCKLFSGDDGSTCLAIDIRYSTGENEKLGVFRTTCNSGKAMQIMADFASDFIKEAESCMCENKADFIWEGYSVRAYNRAGIGCEWRYVEDIPAARVIKNELLKHYRYVAIRDNTTRKETIFDGVREAYIHDKAVRERLRTLLSKALNLYTGQHIGFRDNRKDLLDALYGELGADEDELRQLNVLQLLTR